MTDALSVSEDDSENQYALSVDTSMPGAVTKSVNIPVGYRTKWSPNGNFLLAQIGYRSDKSASDESTLHNLIHDTSCMLNLHLPSEVDMQNIQRVASGSVSWTDDERYLVLNTKIARNTNSVSRMFIIDHKDQSAKPLNFTSPEIVIGDVQYFPSNNQFAVASIFDPSVNEEFVIYFIDFEKSVYWLASHQITNSELVGAFLENGEQFIYSCFNRDGRGAALCSNDVQSTD